MGVPLRAVVLFIAVLTMTAHRVEASSSIALAGAARAYGFLYRSVGTEASAHLSRPGLSVVLRVADRRYQVNDSVLYLPHPPAFVNNEIYVDSSFETVLAGLADEYPWPPIKRNSVSAIVPNAPVATPALSVSAKYVDATQTIAVSGAAPPRSSISVVAQAFISRDIPAITVARATAIADNDGSYKTVLSVVSMTFPNTVLHFVVTAGPNVTPATAILRLGPPNPAFKTDNDIVPSN